jgi:Putative Actinobacterial Holin-X, holin superfamily III
MTDVTPNTSTGADTPTAELVRQTAEQISRLVRDELALARAEMTEKGKRAGLGAGLLGSGGLVGLYGVAALLSAVVLGLAEAMPAWLAALGVAVVLFAVAAILGIMGRRQVSAAVPPLPTETMRSVQADIDEVQERARR